MKVTIYDLLKKSRWLGFSAAITGAALLLFFYFFRDNGITFLQFFEQKNSDGDHYIKIWVGFVFGGTVWMVIADSVADSLKRGMSEDDIKKLDRK